MEDLVKTLYRLILQGSSKQLGHRSWQGSLIAVKRGVKEGKGLRSTLVAGRLFGGALLSVFLYFFVEGFFVTAVDHRAAMQGVHGRNIIMLLAYGQCVQYPAERLE